MKTLVALVTACLLLSGCSLILPKEAPPGTAERSCEDKADAEPAVRNFNATRGVNANPVDFTEEYRAARAAAVAECLRVRNGRPKGGVEKVIR